MDLSIEIKQKQTLTPQMIEAMKILQMNVQDLSEYLETAALENPVFDMESSENTLPDSQEQEIQKKIEWLDRTSPIKNSYKEKSSWEPSNSFAEERKFQNSENDFREDLFFQLRLSDFSKPVARGIKEIVLNLAPNGYLDEPIEQIAKRIGISKVEIDQALKVVQSLEPAGIGARSLSECLCLQLKRQKKGGLPLLIAEHYLKEVGEGHYHRIIKETHASPTEIQEACSIIRSLNPKPCSNYGQDEETQYITPDLFVFSQDDKLRVSLNDNCLPSLHISGYYQKLLQRTDDSQVKSYLSGKFKQAQWLVQSISQRRETLLSCASCLVQEQQDFFLKGSYLKPLSLQDISQKLGIHESTVSRAIKGKYLQCDRGTYPLSYFFSHRLKGVEQEQDTSAAQAKALLKKLIQEEDKKKPLSDQKLSELLQAQKITLSRRTVAKYREELEILPASGRRKY